MTPASRPARDASASRLPLPLLVGCVLFVCAIGYIVASSLTRRSAPTFAPSPAGAAIGAAIGAREGVAETLTVDATSSTAWRFVDLDAGVVLGAADTAGWDLAVRRYRLVTPDSAADLGRRRFTDVTRPPAAGFVATSVTGDTLNAALERWYDYGLLSHLLRSKGHIYALRTTAGESMKLELLSYYCPGLRAGCVTFRFARLSRR